MPLNKNRKRHALLAAAIPLFLFILLIPSAHAHCPLCTRGAMAAAGTAAYFGVKGTVIALFLGAFAVSMGWWVGRLIKKEYVPYQTFWLILLSFLTTVLPIMSILKSNTPADYYPVLIAVAGDYGSLLNRTYLILIPLVTAIVGGLIVCATPWLSKKISEARAGKIIPYQGTMLTLTLLILGAVGVQLLT